MLKKTDGIVTERYERIKEYWLAKGGILTMTTPSLEVREFKGGNNGSLFLAYITSEDGRTLRTRYDDAFWEPQINKQIFRFRDEMADQDCRSRISAELNRRATEIEKKIVAYQKNVADLREQANKICR